MTSLSASELDSSHVYSKIKELMNLLSAWESLEFSLLGYKGCLAPDNTVWLIFFPLLTRLVLILAIFYIVSGNRTLFSFNYCMVKSVHLFLFLVACSKRKERSELIKKQHVYFVLLNLKWHLYLTLLLVYLWIFYHSLGIFLSSHDHLFLIMIAF